MKLRVTLFIAFLATSMFFASCGKEAESPKSEQLNVVTTVGMITDITQRIGGDKVKVTGLMGAGVDPHTYKASEGDVARLSDADLILFNGLHLEGAMGDLLEQMGKSKKTVAVGESVPVDKRLAHADYENAYDPHVWFDVSLWKHVVDTVVFTLSKMDPDNAKLYGDNTAKLQARLDTLHAWVQEQAARVPEGQRVVITAHDAFNYFGRAYGFQVRGLQGISTAAEAGTADVQDLAAFIADNKIPSMFVESSVPTRSIEAVQAAVESRGFAVSIGGELFSDAMGDGGTHEGTYVGMVEHNVSTIVSALLGETPQEGSH